MKVGARHRIHRPTPTKLRPKLSTVLNDLGQCRPQELGINLWSENIGNIHQPAQPLASSVWSQWTWRPKARISTLVETSSPLFWWDFDIISIYRMLLVQLFFMLLSIQSFSSGSGMWKAPAKGGANQWESTRIRLSSRFWRMVGKSSLKRPGDSTWFIHDMFMSRIH